MNWVLLALVTVSLWLTASYCLKLRQIGQSPLQLQPASLTPPLPTLAVIIPAYNEADNIEACVVAALNSTTLTAEHFQLWVVDDQSSDETGTIVKTLQQRLQDPRLHLLAGQSRPTGETWVGKNWACAQVAEQTDSDFLLFIDADTRLKPSGIATALAFMQQEQADLLSCGPEVICGCLAEWLVQPLMIGLIVVSCNFDEINDPSTKKAFAAGPFMLFRRTAYDKIGGHRAVADQVVEDVELSRRIKFSGLKLRYLEGRDLISVRMYRNWATLWEGWTKNFYLGTQRNLNSMILFVGFILLIATVPWVGLLLALTTGLLNGWNFALLLTILLALLTIGLHAYFRRLLAAITGIAPAYWWLTGLGGLAVAAIAIGSIIKTETGWGWTWRGRSLMPTQPDV